MSDYNRTTRECSVNQLHPELFRAIQNYFQEHNLGDLNTEALACCETTSQRKSTGRLITWLNGEQDTTIHMGMLLTPERLIWARSGDKSGTLLASADLKQISVKVRTSLLMKDAGLEVSGYVDGSNSLVRGSIGIGSESAAQKFYDKVHQAIIKVNPPNKDIWPKWMGR
jgi:hypothetical protein